MSGHGAWMTVEAAAAFLSLTPVGLRRSLDRNAQRTDDGATIAQLDGVTARKLGRQWRVWLDARWTQPHAAR